MELKDILLKDHVLDTLQHIGYNGVPAKENIDSISKFIIQGGTFFLTE